MHFRLPSCARSSSSSFFFKKKSERVKENLRNRWCLVPPSRYLPYNKKKNYEEEKNDEKDDADEEKNWHIHDENRKRSIRRQQSIVLLLKSLKLNGPCGMSINDTSYVFFFFFYLFVVVVFFFLLHLAYDKHKSLEFLTVVEWQQTSVFLFILNQSDLRSIHEK